MWTGKSGNKNDAAKKNHQETAYSYLKGEFAMLLKVKYEPVFRLLNISTK